MVIPTIENLFAEIVVVCVSNAPTIWVDDDIPYIKPMGVDRRMISPTVRAVSWKQDSFRESGGLWPKSTVVAFFSKEHLFLEFFFSQPPEIKRR